MQKIFQSKNKKRKILAKKVRPVRFWGLAKRLEHIRNKGHNNKIGD